MLVRTKGLEPLASTLATSRSASELHPRISERVRPSRLHVLQKVLTSSGSHPDVANTSVRVGRTCALRVEELDARCEIRVRALIQVPDCQTASWPNVRRRGPYAQRVRIRIEDGTLFGWFSPTLRRISGGQAPVGAPSGLRLRGKGALKTVTDRARSRSREGFSRTAVTSYP
jgi:hypothetical protein